MSGEVETRQSLESIAILEERFTKGVDRILERESAEVWEDLLRLGRFGLSKTTLTTQAAELTQADNSELEEVWKSKRTTTILGVPLNSVWEIGISSIGSSMDETFKSGVEKPAKWVLIPSTGELKIASWQIRNPLKPKRETYYIGQVDYEENLSLALSILESEVVDDKKE